MTAFQTKREQAAEFAGRVKAWGFTVYLAKSGDHGFITDATESRVMSFSFSGIGSSLGGNYGPPSRESGTGWQLSKEVWQLRTAKDVRDALYEQPPAFTGRGWKYLTNVKQHLATYGQSSGYERV